MSDLESLSYTYVNHQFEVQTPGLMRSTMWEILRAGNVTKRMAVTAAGTGSIFAPAPEQLGDRTPCADCYRVSA